MAIRFRYSKGLAMLVLSNNGRSQMSDITAGRLVRNGVSLSGRLAAGWRAMARAIERRASRRNLAELDDRMLKDLGISRAQAEFEASRPVWQADSTCR